MSNIMKMLNLLGFGEHSGNGVSDIFSVWEEAGLSEPLIEEHFGEEGPDKTVVILPLTSNDQALFKKSLKKGLKKGLIKRQMILKMRRTSDASE